MIVTNRLGKVTQRNSFGDRWRLAVKKVEKLTLSVVNSQVEILRRAFIVEMTSAHNHSVTLFPGSLLEADWLISSAQSILTLLEGTTGASFPTPLSAALYFYATVAEIFSSKTLNSKCFLCGYRLEDTDWIDRLAQARNMISANSDIAWELISHFRITCSMRVISRPEPQS